MTAALVPELDVSDLAQSLAFYVDVLGFSVAFERPEEGFAYIRREAAELMLEAAAGPGRRFRTAPLERPFGRGINLQIAVGDARALHDGALAAGHTPLIALEERWYRRGETEAGLRQFVLADPDGYLLRFAQSLGERPTSSTESPGPAACAHPGRSGC